MSCCYSICFKKLNYHSTCINYTLFIYIYISQLSIFVSKQCMYTYFSIIIQKVNNYIYFIHQFIFEHFSCSFVDQILKLILELKSLILGRRYQYTSPQTYFSSKLSIFQNIIQKSGIMKIYKTNKYQHLKLILN